MTNKKITTYPCDLGLPPDRLVNFESEHNTNRINWLPKTQSQSKGTVNPTHGNRTTMSSDGSPYGNGDMQEETGLFQDSGQKGYKLSTTAGNAHQQNCEIKFKDNARWMPASIFNGCAFQIHQNSDSKHALYADMYCLIFINKSSESYRFVGNTFGDGHNGGPYSGYRYAHFRSTSMINEVRSFGNDWLFYGIIVHVRNGGGAGSSSSTFKLWDLKMYHKTSETSSSVRMIPEKARPLAYRTDSFTGFDAY